MMDATPLFPVPYHPGNYQYRRDWKGKSKHLTRTQRPVKYYFIDFGYARRYPQGDKNPLEIPTMGGDKTLPELKTRAPCNPFKGDIYCLGNLIREEFIQKALGFEYMNDLVADMVRDEPSMRPSIDEVVTRFDTIRVGLGSSALRSRFVKRDDSSFFGFFPLLLSLLEENHICSDAKSCSAYAGLLNFLVIGVCGDFPVVYVIS